jgi:hypothetical protein
MKPPYEIPIEWIVSTPSSSMIVVRYWAIRVIEYGASGFDDSPWPR